MEYLPITDFMLRIVENKLKCVQNEAMQDMLDNTIEAAAASGRWAACEALLNGLTPEDAGDALKIIPVDWMQRKGWQEIINQFSGLVDDSRDGTK